MRFVLPINFLLVPACRLQTAMRLRCIRREQNSQLGALRGLVATLTLREREVFSLVVRGKLNKQIAHELGTSERTVKRQLCARGLCA